MINSLDTVGGNDYSDGKAWHAAAAKLMAKYGTDWLFQDGFDISRLTDKEIKEYLDIKLRTQLDRG